MPQTVLPAPWLSADVGKPATAGSAFLENNRFIVNGAGKDIGGAADQFQFVYQLLTGDGDIVARVDSLTNTHTWAKAGLMMRESLTANSANAFVLMTPARGAAFQHRQTADGSTTLQSSGRSRTPRWLRLERRGDTLRAFESADGANWQAIGSKTMMLPATLYVGLAVTSHNASKLATATFANVAVTQAAPPNDPPGVTLTSPAGGATYSAPATITLAATASDADGSITRVEFYSGPTLIATDSASPYTVNWSGVGEGSYTLRARAVDDDGATADSGPVTVTVAVAPNQAPTVSITAPGAGTVLGAPMYVPIAAAAVDPDGSIARVDFYAGSTQIGSDSTSPYGVTWSVGAPGTYVLTARAIDNAGATAVSGSVTVSVNPTWAVFIPPSDHEAAVTSYLLEIFPEGADPSASLPLRSMNMGKPSAVDGEIRVDVSSAIQPLAAGTYFATVGAVRSTGSMRSSPSGTFAR